MASKLLSESKSSFWTSNKKLIGVISILAFATIAAGFFIYSKDETKTDPLAGIPPPQLLPERWLLKYFGTTNPDDEKVGGYFGDPDSDKLNNYQEYIYGTDPTNRDTDGDLYFDGTEVAYGHNPLGEYVRSAFDTIDRQLRLAGIDFDRESVEKDFQEYLHAERDPYVSGIIEDNKLTIVPDNSQQAINEYYTKFKEITVYKNELQVQNMLSSVFQLSDLKTVQEFVKEQTTMIEKLKALPVPSSLANLHKTYIQMFDGYLGMGKFYLSEAGKGQLPQPGNFYPELNYMLRLDSDLAEHKQEAFDKYQIKI